MAGRWSMAKAASKKLANAFGKAVQHPEATPEGRKLVYESKTIKNMPGDYAPTPEDTPAQRAFKAGRYQGDENYELSRDAIDNRYNGDDQDVRKAVAGQEVDATEDFNSDYRLKEDFDKAFENAFKKESDWLEEGWMRDPDKKFGGMPKLSDDEYQWLGSAFMADKADRDKYIRDKMIKELQDGLPLSDFFERYRMNGR